MAPTPSPLREALRPDSPRRRARMIAIITVAALAPVGIGVGIASLAGGHHHSRPGSSVRPAVTTLPGGG